MRLQTGFFTEYSSSSTSSSTKQKSDAQTLAVDGVTEGVERITELTAEDLLGLFVRLWEALQGEALVPALLRVQLLLHKFKDQTVRQAT